VNCHDSGRQRRQRLGDAVGGKDQVERGQAEGKNNQKIIEMTGIRSSRRRTNRGSLRYERGNSMRDAPFAVPGRCTANVVPMRQPFAAA
jgi:hypothetical protein